MTFSPTPARDLLSRNALEDARLRLTVTRGRATTDPLHGARLEPTVLLTAAPLEPYPPEYYQKGMTVIVLDEQKLNPYDLQAGHKTLNYFSRLSALRERTAAVVARRSGSTSTTIYSRARSRMCFWSKGGSIFTPPTNEELRDEGIRAVTPFPHSAVLPGITRSVIFDLVAELQLPIVQHGLSINELLEADEVFITNSNMGVMPVCRVERRAIGSDKPGPITRRLMEAYAELIRRESSDL